MTSETILFASSNGTDTIHAKLWLPEGDPVAVVQLVHGMCEFIGRYEALAEFLTGAGYAVCGDDHLGHGDSVGEKGYGYFAPADGWLCMTEDLRTLTLRMQERFPGLPYFLVGHSMGSFLSRVYGAKYGALLDGLVLCGTAGPNPMAGLGIRAAQLVGRVKGELYRSSLLQNLAFGSYNKRWSPPRTPYDWISRDRQVVDKYAADPRCTFIFTASAFEDLLRMLQYISRPRWAQELPKDLPLLLIAGQEDPVGDYGRGVETIHDRLKAAGVRDLSLKLYPGDRHEIFNEPDRMQVYGDLLTWLERRRKERRAHGAGQ